MAIHCTQLKQIPIPFLASMFSFLFCYIKMVTICMVGVIVPSLLVDFLCGVVYFSLLIQCIY